MLKRTTFQYISFAEKHHNDIYKTAIILPNGKKQKCTLINVDGNIADITVDSELKRIPLKQLEIEITEPAYDQELDLFRSEMSHELKYRGAKGFVKTVAESAAIDILLNSHRSVEALYLSAMSEYLCKKAEEPLISLPKEIKDIHLPSMLYPFSAILRYRAGDSPFIFLRLRNKAIQEFVNYGIIEGEIDNVC